MPSENTVEKPFSAADKQRLIDRIKELELENAHLKAENAGLAAEVAEFHEQISKAESEPEFSEAFNEAVEKHK